MTAFQREFTLLAEIEHPQIARAHDFGYIEGRPFFTSEFIPGSSLSNELPARDIDQFAGCARDLVSAVAFLHRNRILHLDVKPGNVIAPHSDRGHAVLIDFGLVRSHDALDAEAWQRGSLPYMAPEYVQRRPFGPWTDIYAIGVTLYRFATGQYPRKGVSIAASPSGLASAWNPAPRPPSSLCDWATPDLDSIVLGCLALEPSARFQDAGELELAIARWTHTARRPLRPRTWTTRTIGRQLELGRIEEFLDGIRGAVNSVGKSALDSPDADNRESPRKTPPSTTLLLSAEPGFGQSHLLREAKTRAQTAGLSMYIETGYEGLTTTPGALLRCLPAQVAPETPSPAERWRSFLERLASPRPSARPELSDAERKLRRAGEVAHIANAIRTPVVIAVDGLQHFDEVSIALIVDLVRVLGESPPSIRAPIGVIVAYREEGPNRSLLRELSDYLLRRDASLTVTLGPLQLRESMELYRIYGGSFDRESALSVHRRTGGSPSELQDLSSGIRRRQSEGAQDETSSETWSLGAIEQRLALVLALIRRPCDEETLACIVECSRSEALDHLGRLQSLGLARLDDREGAGLAWIATSTTRALVEDATEGERRSIHRRIADSIVETHGEEGSLELFAAVHHYRRARDAAHVRQFGRVVARYLKSIYLNRAALEAFDCVLEVLPRGEVVQRVEIELEMASLRVRLGELEVGIHRLRDARRENPDLPLASQLRVVLWLATFHGRRGDYKRAEALFAEGLRLEQEARQAEPAKETAGDGPMSRHETQFFINERAAMKVFTGDFEGARALCEEGLDQAGDDTSFRVREMTLNLLATRANVSMRQFDYAAAAVDFESSLEIAEAIGSPANQAVIWNNLGIVYGSSERYREAIQAYTEAERTSLQLDEGPSLVSTYGNLAVLYSRLGEYEKMEETLAKAEALGPFGMGKRQELFYRHSRGLCLLYRGRFRDAQPDFERATRLAEEIGDRLLAAFDGIYRGEALLGRGDLEEADRELDSWSRPEQPPRVRKMALARLALVRALRQDPEAARRALREEEDIAETVDVPLLTAWSRVFRAQATSMIDPSDAEVTRLGTELDRAEEFFEACGLRPAATWTRWVRAERHFLEGRLDSARDLLAIENPVHNELTAVLYPLLEARLVLEDAKEVADIGSAAELLAAAGRALLGNELAELSSRVLDLRGLLRGQEPSAASSASTYRRRWAAGALPSHLCDLDDPSTLIPSEHSTSIRTVLLTREGCSRVDLVCHSPPMKKLCELLDRIAASDLPVLIEGEIGTGKELIAGILHMESRRRGHPLTVIPATSLTTDLAEAELFGAVEGAYTDLHEDRTGVLEMAAGGTVLVDEVSDLPAEIQSKLLRVLATLRFRPVGADQERSLDVRFLFSTSRDLDAEVEAGRLRADLLHRVRVLRLSVPPLRDRHEDFDELASLFLQEGDAPTPRIAKAGLRALFRREWPGNVREFRNVLLELRVRNPTYISAAAVEGRQDSEEETADSTFPTALLASGELDALRDQLEHDWMVYHLQRLGGDTTALSRQLGISRQQLYRRCKRLGIRLRRGRGGLSSS